jgi:hypothetical protein
MNQIPESVPSHSVYGPKLVERSPNLYVWMLVGMGMFVGSLAMISWGIQNRLHPSAMWNQGATWFCIGGGGIGLFLSLLLPALSLTKKTTFYERGVVQRKLTGEKAFAYEECGEFTFKLVRQYVNGIYVGTVYILVMVAMTNRGVRIIKVSGLHAERRTSGFFRLTEKFEGQDDMDVLTRLIARSMVTRKLREEEDPRIRWCGAGELSREGFTPSKGRLKKTLVPMNELMVATQSGYMQLSSTRDRKPFLTIPCSGSNFLVGVEFIAAVAQAAAAEQHEQELVEAA